MANRKITPAIANSIGMIKYNFIFSAPDTKIRVGPSALPIIPMLPASAGLPVYFQITIRGNIIKTAIMINDNKDDIIVMIRTVFLIIFICIPPFTHDKPYTGRLESRYI